MTSKKIMMSGYYILSKPGFGKSKNQKYKPSDEESCRKFLTKLIETLHIERPVVVSPSMSGRFSLAFIMGDDPSQCHKRVRAFVPVAPGTTDKYTRNQYKNCSVSPYWWYMPDLGLNTLKSS